MPISALPSPAAGTNAASPRSWPSRRSAKLPAADIPDKQLAARARQALDDRRARIVEGMNDALHYPGLQHVRLMRYHLGWEDATGAVIEEGPTGKLLRPVLCLLSCEAVGGDPARALSAAVAVELLHNFTLIHDDIEDGSEMRHGRPALWTIAGVPQAINAGDGMYALAHRTLLRISDAGVPAERVLDAVRILDDACIALCEGQHADLSFESRPNVTPDEYQSMIAGKTSALLGAAAAIGAVAGGADRATVDAFAASGILLGLAFQAQDDVLGIWGDEELTGKPVAADIRSRKKSFPVVHAFRELDAAGRAEIGAIYAAEGMAEHDITRVLALLDEAGSRAAATSAAERWAAAAIEKLRPLRLDPGPRADIEALASYFVQRSV